MWKDKPTALVSAGGGGGGMRAVTILTQLLNDGDVAVKLMPDSGVHVKIFTRDNPPMAGPMQGVKARTILVLFLCVVFAPHIVSVLFACTGKRRRCLGTTVCGH